MASREQLIARMAHAEDPIDRFGRFGEPRHVRPPFAGQSFAGQRFTVRQVGGRMVIEVIE